MESRIATALRDRLATLLPAGYDAESIRLIEVEGTVSEPTDTDLTLAAATTADMMRNGKPNVLKVEAWMCHAGAFNGNGDGFVAEDLKAVVEAGLFEAPNLGVMDWNHSAVVQWAGDPPIIGAWYDSQYGFNPAALKGEGAWGVKVTGMMFSWLFPEQAQHMIEDQAAMGSIRFSMACIPQRVEQATLRGVTGTLLREPMFFTHSALSVPPADPDAVGRMELSKVDDQEARATSVAAAVNNWSVTLPTAVTASTGTTTTTVHLHQWIIKQLDAHEATSEDAAMTLEELQAELETIKAESATKVEEILATVTSKDTTIAAQVAEIADLTAKLADAAVAMDTVTTAFEATKAELATANETIATLNAQLEVFAAEQAKVEADAAAAAKVALVASRLAELGPEFGAAHAKRDEAKRLKVEERFAALSDEDWADEKELLGSIPAKVGFVARSKAEGPLPTGESREGSIHAELAALIKR